ncbi:MAG TPA: AbrB/MazE/SpoVT family DNA-binding domain-containing protein [Acidobacteriota bacterium]
MPVATVTSKGQITIPKPIRDALELNSGDQVAFQLRDDGVVEMVAETVDPLALYQAIKPKRRGVTVQAMDRAVRKAATRR